MKANLSTLADVLAAQRQNTRPTSTRKKATDTQGQANSEPNAGNTTRK
ncbi:hypothetical protein [Hymenobacter tenuis]